MNSKFKAGSHLDSRHQLKIRGAKFSGRTVACFSYYPNNQDDMTIFLSDRLIKNDRRTLEQSTQNQIDMKNWSASDKQDLINHTISHEYGHFIQKLIVDKQLKQDNVDMSDVNTVKLTRRLYERKAKQEILKICKEQFKDDNEFISRYGNKDSAEFFAEAFANLADCKNPTNIAKATEIYIKENL